MAFVSAEKRWNDEEYVEMDIFTAANVGCIEKIQQYFQTLDHKIDVDEYSLGGWTALMYACYSGNYDIVTFLLRKGASAAVRNSSGHNALILATKCGYTKCVLSLIQHGADIEAKDNFQWTALFHAAWTGYYDVLQLLIEKGCIVNTYDIRGFSPLMLAAEAGHEMIVNHLLQHGAKVSVLSNTGDGAYSLAIKNNHGKIQSILEAHLHRKQSLSPAIKQSIFHNPRSILEILEGLGLSKYYHIFQSHNIDVNGFWTLSDKDLRDFGIELLGPRKKITTAIAQWHQNKTVRNGRSPASDQMLPITPQRMKQEHFEIKAQNEKMLKIQTQQMLKGYVEKAQRVSLDITALTECLRQSLSHVLYQISEEQDHHHRLNVQDILRTFNYMNNTINDIDEEVNEFARTVSECFTKSHIL